MEISYFFNGLRHFSAPTICHHLANHSGKYRLSGILQENAAANPI